MNRVSETQQWRAQTFRRTGPPGGKLHATVAVNREIQVTMKKIEWLPDYEAIAEMRKFATSDILRNAFGKKWKRLEDFFIENIVFT